MRFGKLVLIGCGGTGSWLAEGLIRLLAYHENGTREVVLIDGDKFEEKNLERQMFDPKLVGMNKAKATAKRLTGLCKPKIIESYMNKENFIAEMMSIKGFCESFPLVILAVDNHASRKALITAMDEMPIQHFCVITPGNELDFGRTGVYLKMHGAAVTGNPVEMYPDIKDPQDRIPGGCQEKAPSTPQLIGANAGAAVLTLWTIQAMLDGRPWYEEAHFNTRTFKILGQGEPLGAAKPVKAEAIAAE